MEQLLSPEIQTSGEAEARPGGSVIIAQFLSHLAEERIISTAQLQLARKALGVWRPDSNQERAAAAAPRADTEDESTADPASKSYPSPSQVQSHGMPHAQPPPAADVAEGPLTLLPDSLLDQLLSPLTAAPGTSSIRRTCRALRAAFDRCNTRLALRALPGTGLAQLGGVLHACKVLSSAPRVSSLSVDDDKEWRIWYLILHSGLLQRLERLCWAPRTYLVSCDLFLCRKLRHLELRNRPGLNDIRFLASCAQLQHLDLGGCGDLKDVAPLSACVELQHLNLRGCSGVEDLGPLAACAELQHLDLSRCGNLYACILKGLEALSSCTKLQHLDLTDVHLTDLALLSAHTGLQHLSLRYCSHIEHLGPLSACVGLRHLDCSGCRRIAGVAPLASCTQLRWLGLGACDVEDLGPLAACVRLERLDLSGNRRLDDLGPLAACASLLQLDLGSCERLQLLDPLAACVKLRYLDLGRYSAVQSLGPLAALVDLQCLGFRESQVALDLGPLAALPGLAISRI